jgi:hypothetical protein
MILGYCGGSPSSKWCSDELFYNRLFCEDYCAKSHHATDYYWEHYFAISWSKFGLDKRATFTHGKT